MAIWLGTMLAVAGCGGPNHQAQQSTEAARQEAQVQAQQNWAKCMRDHGFVPVTASGSGSQAQGGTQPVSPQEQSAEQSCRSILSSAGVTNQTPVNSTRMMDAALQYAACMRKHGVDMSDPVPNAAGYSVQVNSDVHSPQYQQAQQACEQYAVEAARAAGGQGG